MSPKTTTIWLRESFPWMGSHSGYDQICKTIETIEPGNYHNIVRTPKSIGRVNRRLISPILSNITTRVSTSVTYEKSSAFMELSALQHCFFNQKSLVHVLYVERMLGLLAHCRERLPYKLIATAHQPTALWRLRRHQPEILSCLDALIVLSSSEVDFFDSFLPGRVHLILHGVDTDFFCPNLQAQPSTEQKKARFIFSGTWLRDIETLAQVIEGVLQENPNIGFDMVVPTRKRQEPPFIRIAQHEQVRWHAGISDEQLRNLYRQATALVLPITDCTANNAVVEAIACGLPIISNNVGGMPDYTRSSFATLLPPRDIGGFIEAILTLEKRSDFRKIQGKAAREFAVNYLSWPTIAEQTLSIYKKVN